MMMGVIGVSLAGWSCLDIKPERPSLSSRMRVGPELHPSGEARFQDIESRDAGGGTDGG